MKTREQAVEGIPDFWQRVRGERRRFLAVDYDGTLAPFRTERMKAVPVRGTIPLLSQIAADGSTRLVIVSGRPVSELRALLGPLAVEMVGVHGFEYGDGQGCLRQTEPDRIQKEGLEEAFRRVLRAGFPAASLERKSASLVFHTRGWPHGEDSADRVRQLWFPLAERHGLFVQEFNGGIELRADGVNKGTALLEFLKTESEGPLVIYIGDDETDEDAFGAISSFGIGIKVGAEGETTKAKGRLPGCTAVREFLRTWRRMTEAP